MKGKGCGTAAVSHRMTREDAEGLAIAALGFIAGDAERLGRFLALTGLGPETLRQAARDKGFLGQVLDFMAEDELLLLAFAADVGEKSDEYRGGASHSRRASSCAGRSLSAMMLCRDCLGWSDGSPSIRCSLCGSPRTCDTRS